MDYSKLKKGDIVHCMSQLKLRFEQEEEDYSAADFGCACAIIFPKNGRAEIRKGTNQK